MPVETAVTEIADSEEEPLSSSPVAVSDGAPDKLSATARHDSQAVACPHQEPLERAAIESSGHTECLDADLVKPWSDLSSAPVDHLDVQPLHQGKTDNASTCTIQVDATADAHSPLAGPHAVTVGQASDIGEHNAAGSSSTSPDLDIRPASETTTRLREQTSLPADSRVKTDNLCDEYRVQGLPESSSLDSTNANTEETDVPRDNSQYSATCNKSATSEPAKGGPAYAVTDISEHVEKGVTARPSQGSTEQADGEASAERLGHDPSQEAAKASPNLSAVCPAEAHDIDNASSSVVDVADIMDMDQPKAADLAVPCNNSIQQNDVSGVTSAPPDDSGAAANAQPPGANSTAAPRIPGENEEHGRNRHHRLSPDTSSQSKTEGAHEKQSEHEITSHVEEAATDVPPSLLPADLAAQPSDGGQTAQGTLETVVQDPTTPIPIVETDNSQNLTSTESQAESQPRSSQPIEPTPAHTSTKLSPQEITLAELRAQKAGLLASLKDLPAIQALIEENQTSDVDMSDDDDEPTDADITAAANKLVKAHIKLLHEYNELKDVGQGLMGLIADQRGVRIVEVQDEFGIDADD